MEIILLLLLKPSLNDFDRSSIERIQSYLGERKYCVNIETKTRDVLDYEESGAPRGAELAVIFHIINSNYQPDCREEPESLVFVDDANDSVSPRRQ